MISRRALLAAGAAWGAGATRVQAQAFPDRPIRMIVPFAAGGAADLIVRLYADALGASFGQQFIVENRTGAGGLVGAQGVARADPDGYLLMGAGMSSHVLAPATSKNPGFDPVADFTHIAFFGGAPSVFLAHPVQKRAADAAHALFKEKKRRPDIPAEVCVLLAWPQAL